MANTLMERRPDIWSDRQKADEWNVFLNVLTEGGTAESENKFQKVFFSVQRQLKYLSSPRSATDGAHQCRIARCCLVTDTINRTLFFHPDVILSLQPLQKCGNVVTK